MEEIEETKLRELSQGFLKKNIVYRNVDTRGKIIHKFANGRTRKIDLFKRLVKILDENENELYSNTLESNHPLIICANLYYKFNFLVKCHACAGYFEAKSLEREKKSILSQTEEIYQVL